MENTHIRISQLPLPTANNKRRGLKFRILSREALISFRFIMNFTAWGCILAALSVALGAFGAHGLKESVTPERLLVFETAARYHMYHALALIAFGIWKQVSGSSAEWVGYAFLIGIILFSGSLYALVLLDKGFLGAITPFGGVAFIIAWVGWAIAAFKSNG